MTNPLIEKFYELHPEKKEKPKLPRIEDYEGEETIADELKSLKSKPPSLTSYDPHSGEDSFLQIAEKVKNKDAKVTSVSIERDMSMMGITTVTFEVQMWDT
jgi:hypothetical protein